MSQKKSVPSEFALLLPAFPPHFIPGVLQKKPDVYIVYYGILHYIIMWYIIIIIISIVYMVYYYIL